MKKPAFTLHSPETGTDYWIYVKEPAAPAPWTAIAFMDADDMFADAVKACAEASAQTAMPALLLVGVGYGGSFSKPANKRVRDYTTVRAHDEPLSGKSAEFRKFLQNTLWPELERRYTISPGARGVAGYSLGALLVLDALFQAEPFFTHFLAGSPSIWWGDRAILAQISALHAHKPDLAGKLFLSVGEKDSESMTGDLARLETQLAALPFPNLEATVRKFPGKHHFNATPISFETGLAQLFGLGSA